MGMPFNVSRSELVKAFKSHACTGRCMVLSADAVEAGVMPPFPSYAPVNRSPKSKPKSRRIVSVESAARSSRRQAKTRTQVENDEKDKMWWSNNWPQAESDDTLRQVYFFILIFSITSLILSSDLARTSSRNNGGSPCTYPLLLLQPLRTCVRDKGPHNSGTRHITSRVRHVPTSEAVQGSTNIVPSTCEWGVPDVSFM